MSPTPDSLSPEDVPLEEVDLPGFAPSSRNRLEPPQPGATATTPPRIKDDELLDELDEHPERFELTEPKMPPSSSRGSIEPSAEAAETFGQLAALLVKLGSLGLNRTVGRGSGAWIATDEEAADIAVPLGRIAARHAPITGEAAGDVADVIEAGFGAAAYGMRATVDQAVITAPPAPRPEDLQ